MALLSFSSLGRALGLLAVAFLVLPARAPAHEKGALRVADRRLAPGTWIGVTGSKFLRGSALALTLEGPGGRLPLAQVAVDAGGAFSDSVRVPAEARPGLYRLVARAADGDVVAGLDVEVVSAPPSSAAHATHSAQLPMPSAEPLRLDRVRSHTLTGVTIAAIFTLLGLGVLLLRRSADPHTDRS
ncbi:MAG: hypothetical protein AAB409_08905 [Gemmatimonadota bacterium]